MGGTIDVVAVLLEHLREHHPNYVLASPDDADYFRKKAAARVPAVQVRVEAPVIKPVPPPAVKEAAPPVVKEEEAARPQTPLLSGVRNLLSVVAPEMPILNEIPSDAIAYKISERWKTKNLSAPISILLFQEPPEQRALLEQIARALDVYFGPAKIVYAERIEKDKQWESFLSVDGLKMIIVCDYTLWQLNGLMPFYKESQGARILGSTPLFLLPDLALYLKDPLLKRSLWKALCQKCS